MTLSRQTVWRMNVVGEADSQAVVNVIDYRNIAAADPGPLDTPEEFALAFASDWRIFVLPFISDSYAVVRYLLEEITQIRRPTANSLILTKGQTFELPGGPTDVGGDNSSSSPTFEALGIRKRTGLAGRANRGNMRLGPVPESATLRNTLVPPYSTLVQDALTQFLLDEVIVLATMSMVVFPVVSLWQALPVGGTLILSDLVPTPDVEQLLVNPFITSQVSRKRRNVVG